jgi:2-polyprenyl-3-methyl-5-hydroxy-6-metoxy-1,4-benzoquinol methylase
MLRKDLRKASPIAGGTADPLEIARFDALAEDWWKPDGAFKVIHAFNRVRVAKISDRLPVLFGRDPNAAKPLTGLKIIDVGCGAGLVTRNRYRNWVPRCSASTLPSATWPLPSGMHT